MHQAILYTKLPQKTVRCNLCAHRCLINPQKRGICFVRKNQNGILYSLVYGLAAAAHVDPIEKKPLFHFLPSSKIFSIASAGCNFRCDFCQNWQESQITKDQQGKIEGEKLSPNQIVELALKTGCRSIAYTYTEPTIFFEYAYNTARLAKKKGLLNVFVTNGYQTPETIEKMKGVIDAANVDLKSFSGDFYQKICGAHLKPVLESIKNLYQAGIHLEITTLIIPQKNDSPKELSQIAQFIAGVSPNIPWHISRFHPDYKMTSLSPTPLETLETAYTLGKKAGLKYVYMGNILTQNGENTFCPKCQNLAIKRWGYETQLLAVNPKGQCQKCGQNLHLIL